MCVFVCVLFGLFSPFIVCICVGGMIIVVVSSYCLGTLSRLKMKIGEKQPAN